ncbi:nitrate- and nitrite sensing domain-containing protein [Denitromonas iodatirespirans]|uniref:Nitrate- and nitrite sensing domain-containing protein n=1 Tax=Denitromonas iodatirespirans TaxID=2795389 RepID=A0A944H8F0_DENI1|nr:nitrate- and nitrite sensing domain-containing protein [Denitromonas iodatirespirans]MBT0961315.1 nitrate- and nitrite sensing domain-containing protein [Denitromonas iodatirespirans]
MDTLLWGLGGGLLAVWGAGAVWRARRRAEAERAVAHSLLACRALLVLVAAFQQHRGMSSALLSGDGSFGGPLARKAREIDNVLPELKSVAEAESDAPHPCLTVNDLALFGHRWGRLRETLSSLSVEQSIAQHSALIAQLLQWLAALGEARVEPLFDERSARDVVRNYVSRLPALTECLGQARALGLSVAARGGCSAVARVRLMFLVARAENLLAQASNGVSRGRCADEAEAAVQAMAQMVKTRLLARAAVGVSVQEVFEVASRAVDGVFAWANETGDQLTQARQSSPGNGAATTAWAA